MIGSSDSNAPPYYEATNYTIDVDGLRIPTIVKGNEKLRAKVVNTGEANPTYDEITRALAHALATGEFKPSSEPIPSLGSRFDFPQRVFSQPNIYHTTGKLYGGNWFDNQIAYPEQRKFSLKKPK